MPSRMATMWVVHLPFIDISPVIAASSVTKQTRSGLARTNLIETASSLCSSQ
jgi:hypothetical protein